MNRVTSLPYARCGSAFVCGFAGYADEAQEAQPAAPSHAPARRSPRTLNKDADKKRKTTRTIIHSRPNPPRRCRPG